MVRSDIDKKKDPMRPWKKNGKTKEERRTNVLFHTQSWNCDTIGITTFDTTTENPNAQLNTSESVAKQ